MTLQKSSRLLEMERKKEKLAALRAEKARKEEERRALLQPIENVERRRTATSEELDTLFKSVGITKEKSPVVENSDEEDRENTPVTPVGPVLKPLSPALVKVKSEIESEHKAEHANPRLQPHSLFPAIHKKEIYLYSKGVQTEELPAELTPTMDGFNNDIQLLSPIILNAPVVPEAIIPEKEETKEVELLTEDVKQKIINNPEFQVAFHTASKIMEKHLETRREEVFINYASEEAAEMRSGELLSFKCEYKDQKWTANREVVSMEFSTQFKELLVVAYSPNSEEPHEWRGVVCVWNTKFKQQPPEFLFYCHQRLTCIVFARSNQHLIMAGCSSGRIIVWDSRLAPRKAPVEQSPLTIKTHTYPIFNLDVVGTHNNLQLYSISSEGQICLWNIDKLKFPLCCNDFQCRLEKNLRPVASTSASFHSDGKCFIIGGEDGVVLEFKVKDIQETPLLAEERPKLDATLAYEIKGQSGPIMAVHFHQAKGAVAFSHLFLAASYDWHIKLYSTKDALLHRQFDAHQAPIIDVKWSPVHPAVFASIDQQGMLCLWNLIENMEDPVLTIEVHEGKALKKLDWSRDGREIAIGDITGSVLLYACGPSLYNVKNEIFFKFAGRLAEIKHEAELTEKRLWR